jgi:replicative DNA helicase
MIYSLQVERHVLSGLIRHQNLFADVDIFLNENDFYHEVHSTIYAVYKNTLYKGEKIDKVLLAEKIKNLGISFKDDINIYDYIDNLSFSQITEEATVSACKELMKLRIRREISQTAEKLSKFVKDNGDEDIDKIISQADAIYNDKISSYEINDEPVNLFTGLEDVVEEMGNNPKEEVGLITPYPEFNRLYGGLKNGNIYAIVSRPGQGKSTWINDMCFNVAKNPKNKTKTLILDTEMQTLDIQLRMVSSMTDVPMWYLETGNWRKNQDMTSKVRAAWNTIKNYEYFHYHVGNKNIDQICSIIRRWYLSKVGRGNQALIAYDYVKLTGEKVGQNWAEHQAIGSKIDKLKRISEEIQCPIVTAMQLNRTGENFNRSSANVVDDSSVIALSDRLQWFASFVAIFRRKTLDELALDTQQFGTHKLIPTKTRFQGKEAAGHQDLVRRLDANGKETWAQNYLNYNVHNFKIEERGSLLNVVERQREQYQLDDQNTNDGEVL